MTHHGTPQIDPKTWAVVDEILLTTELRAAGVISETECRRTVADIVSMREDEVWLRACMIGTVVGLSAGALLAFAVRHLGL